MISKVVKQLLPEVQEECRDDDDVLNQLLQGIVEADADLSADYFQVLEETSV